MSYLRDLCVFRGSNKIKHEIKLIRALCSPTFDVVVIFDTNYLSERICI